jgi:membrane protease YdiL (CAAX protease family)
VPPQRPLVAALLLGLAVVLGFVFAEVVAGAVLYGLGAPVELAGELDMAEVLVLGAVKLTSALAAAAVVVWGGLTWARIGVPGPPGSMRAGWNALLPVTILVIALPLGAALASGDPLFDPDLEPRLAVALVALAIVVAVSEELWFRGLLVDALQSARMPWVTIIASAVLFGVPHLPGGPAAMLNALAVTLAVGIPYTVVRLRCGSLVPLVVGHALIDAWAFLHTASVTPQGSPDAGDVAATLVLPSLVAIGYLWWFTRTPRPRTTPPRR